MEQNLEKLYELEKRLFEHRMNRIIEENGQVQNIHDIVNGVFKVEPDYLKVRIAITMCYVARMVEENGTISIERKKEMI